MNGIQETKPAGLQFNRLLDVLVTIIKHKKGTIDNDIYIKFFSNVTVSYLTVSTDDVLNNTNNETSFLEFRRVFEEAFKMKFQQLFVLKYLNLRICHPPLGFSVDHTDHIMELVNEWPPPVKFINVGTPFRTYSKYEKELMAALPLTVNSCHKA